MQEFKEFLQNNKGENRWLRTGQALGAGANIYGHRVDNVHTDVYKMMSTLHRGKEQIELQSDGGNDEGYESGEEGQRRGRGGDGGN